MQRKIFHIFMDNQFLGKKFAWNSATKEARGFLAKRGQIENQDFEKLGWDGIVGDSVLWWWKGTRLGNIVEIKIRREV